MITIVYARWFNYGTWWFSAGADDEDTQYDLACIDGKTWGVFDVVGDIVDSGTENTQGECITAAKASITAGSDWSVTEWGPPS